MIYHLDKNLSGNQPGIQTATCTFIDLIVRFLNYKTNEFAMSRNMETNNSSISYLKKSSLVIFCYFAPTLNQYLLSTYNK